MNRSTRVGWLSLGLCAVVLAAPAWAEMPKRGVRVDGKAAVEYVSEQTGKSWAVVIGVNHYKDKPAIPELRYAVADAKAVGEELKRRGYTVISLLDEDATRDRIMSVLGDELPQKVKPEDRLVIFYAGHGETKSVGGQTMGYLLPVDAKRDRLHMTAVNMGEIRQLSGFLPAKHVLYLVDVCYGGIAGQQTRSLPPQTANYLKQITQEKGRQLITAGGPGQQVVEGPQWGHSVFTYYVLEGLTKGLADLNGDGVIPTSELYAYLDGRVPQAAENQQRPELWSLAPEKGEFVFFTTARPSSVRAEPGRSTGGLGGGSAAASHPVPGPSAALSQAEQELKALEEQERQAEEQDKLAAIQARIEAKKKQAEEKQKKLEVASQPSYNAPKEMGREITGKDGAPMMLVPEGEFLYGKDNQRLSLPAFYMDKYEVTTKLYAAFLQATSRKKPDYWNQVSLTSVGDRPVVGVDWHDADAYCRHYGKRLPTEQEWEKAARGTDGRGYPWGHDEPTSRHANFNKCCDDFKDYGVLVNVGSLEDGKSPYGIYDLAGNVWEWTSSDYKNSGEYKVVRGGAWNLIADYLLSADRLNALPADRGGNGGFRCAKTP